MRALKYILAVTSVVLFSLQSHAQEEKFKALYIYNFTKYMKWPAEKETGDFVIGVVGKSTVTNELLAISKTKKVGETRNIVIKQFASSDQVSSDCHIVYLPSEYTKELPVLVKKTYPSHSLLVTDYKDMASKGSCVNFVMVDNYQKFEISQKHTQLAGIQVASAFLKLAIVVD